MNKIYARAILAYILSSLGRRVSKHTPTRSSLDKIKKYVLGGLLIVALVLVAINIVSNNKSTSDTTVVKIGSILPLTGPLGEIGEEIHRGAKLAVADLKSKGAEVNYISEDDGFDPKLSVSAGSKLINIDKVDAVFTALVEEAKPITTIFNDKHTPLLVTWDSNDTLKNAGAYVFSTGFSTEKSGVIMGDYAYKKLGLREVAIVGDIDPAVEIMVDNFKKTFISNSGNVALEEKIQPDSIDNRSVIAKINNINPDGVYIALLPPQYGPFLKQLRQSGYEGKIMAVDSFLQSEIESAGQSAEGVYFTNIYSERSQEISAKYKEYFGKDPIDPALVSFGYDGIKTLVEASKIAKEKNIPLREALTLVKIDGVGGLIYMNGNQYSERVEKIFVVKNGMTVETD